MNIELQTIDFTETFDGLPVENGAILFHGEMIDDRGRTIISHFNSRHTMNKQIQYFEDQFNISINQDNVHIMSFNDFIARQISSDKSDSIWIEATTLGFAEILLLLDALAANKISKKIYITYAEPKEYKGKIASSFVHDDFDLTRQFASFRPIPGYTLLSAPSSQEKKAELISFLGFERSRLGQILNADDGASYKSLHPIIPLPAFKLGWENRSVKTHLEFFQLDMCQSLKYVSANNPYQALKALEKIVYSRGDEKFIIAPIGTKPNAIGCAIFLVNTKNNESNRTGVLYDFPTKKPERSQGVGKINIYTLSLSA